MNGLLCKDCGQDHQNAGEARECDERVARAHPNYNTGELCYCTRAPLHQEAPHR